MSQGWAFLCTGAAPMSQAKLPSYAGNHLLRRINFCQGGQDGLFLLYVDPAYGAILLPGPDPPDLWLKVGH